METRAPQAIAVVAPVIESKQKRSSAASDLPANKTVEPTSAPGKVRQKLEQDEARRDEARARAEALAQQNLTDVKTHEATGSLVIQTRDGESGEIMHQFPNNATLKSRAIARYEALQGTPTIKRTI